MKRITTWLLCLALALGLTLPAAAEEMDDALAAVTSLVKETLDVDDEYTEFYGNYNDGLRPGWNLTWSDDTRELNVTCTEDALVTNVYVWRSDSGRTHFYGFDAAFPAIPEDEASAEAQRWLERLLGPGESARIDSVSVTLDADAHYQFSGRILINGLESPLTFNLSIGGEGLYSYNRSDSYRPYVGEIPAAQPASGEPIASEALARSVQMELYYVSDGGEARLRYVSVEPTTVVDAMTGETVDMDALYASVRDSWANDTAEEEVAMSAMAADAGTGRALTEVETASIANYADALSQEDIDRALRELTQLGLAAFDLDRCSYNLFSDGRIEASLRYSAALTEDALFGVSPEEYEQARTWGPLTVYKYITADAKSGELLDVSTSYPLWSRQEDAGVQTGEIAESFLTAAAPAYFPETAPCTLTGFADRPGTMYARVCDGYFFPENYLSVSVNAATGTVDEYHRVWDDGMTFAPSKDIVTEEQAKAAYTGALDVTLGYVAWPEGIVGDDPVLLRYLDWGYSWVESLRLAYYYSGRDAVSGVDALTGEAVVTAAPGTYEYDDLAGDPRREMIEELAAAGVGFDGGHFRPDETILTGEALTLLMQAEGYDPRYWDAESLYRQAAYLGFVPAAGLEEDAPLTRMAFLRMLLSASEYGAAARLTDVWSSGYADVAEADEGYASVSRALGMTDGASLEPDAPCTRGDAAELLWRFMRR